MLASLWLGRRVQEGLADRAADDRHLLWRYAETEQPAPTILGGHDDAIRTRLPPVRADVERFGGEGEHGNLETVAVLGLGEARGDEPVVGDDQQRRIFSQVGGCSLGEVSQDAPLGGDCQARERVYDALADPRQDRVAQGTTPGVLVEPVEPDDCQVLHVVRDAKFETPGIILFYSFGHGMCARHVPPSGGDGGEEDLPLVLPRAHRGFILSHPACPYHRALRVRPSESATSARHPNALSVAEMSQVQVWTARSRPRRSSKTGTAEKGLAAHSAARPASVKAAAGRRTVRTVRPSAFSS